MGEHPLCPTVITIKPSCANRVFNSSFMVKRVGTYSKNGPGYTQEIIGYNFVESKSAGFHITPYKSVTPSAAFTEKRSGARHPISYKRSKSGSSNVMMIFPFRFRTTFFGSISTRE